MNFKLYSKFNTLTNILDCYCLIQFYNCIKNLYQQPSPPDLRIFLFFERQKRVNEKQQESQIMGQQRHERSAILCYPFQSIHPSLLQMTSSFILSGFSTSKSNSASSHPTAIKILPLKRTQRMLHFTPISLTLFYFIFF